MPLPLNLQKLGERQGFEDGWTDAMKGQSQNPRPDLGYGTFDGRYFKSYGASYLGGYETGIDERIRREALLARRKQQNEPEREQ